MEGSEALAVPFFDGEEGFFSAVSFLYRLSAVPGFFFREEFFFFEAEFGFPFSGFFPEFPFEKPADPPFSGRFFPAVSLSAVCFPDLLFPVF